MATTYTAEDLIESIRNLGMVPDAGTLGGDDSDIIRHINEALTLDIIPELIQQKEEYLVVTTRQTLSGTTKKYRMPKRAFGDKLRYIRYVDSNGTRDEEPLREITFPHQGEYRWESSSRPAGYYLEGNYICLVGSTFSGSLELSYHFRPGELVKSTTCRKVTVVSGKDVTLDSAVPSAWTTAKKYDVHSAESGAEIKVWSEPVVSCTGTAMTFTNAIDGTTTGTHPVEVGDWVCLEKEAAIPAIPHDLQPLLVRAVAVRMAEAQGDVQDVQVAGSLFEKAQNRMMPIIRDRSGGAKRLTGCEGVLWRMR